MGILIKHTMNDEITVAGNSLTLCDVRIGPTEDKVAFDVESGTYSLMYEWDGESYTGYVCEKGVRDSTPGKVLGEIAIDGSVVGVYDSRLFEQVFNGRPETFYDWGDSNFEPAKVIRVYRESIAPYEFACIPTFNDGTFEIVELTQQNRRVGVCIKYVAPEYQGLDEDIMFQFFLRSASGEVELWLDIAYDDESIADCLLESLHGDGEQEVNAKSAVRFIASIDAISFVKHEGEAASPKDSLTLEDCPESWRSGISEFCEFLSNVMRQ